MMELKIDGLSYADLYRSEPLARLDERFRRELAQADADLGARFEAYRAGADLTPVEESELLIAAARHLSRFLARLFGLEQSTEALSAEIHDFDPIWSFKKEFPGKRAKRVKDEELAAFDVEAFDRVVERLAEWRAGRPGAPADQESRFAAAAMEILAAAADSSDPAGPAGELRKALDGLWQGPQDDAQWLEALVRRIACWCRVRAGDPGPAAGWACFKVPEPVDFGHLVDFERTRPDFPEFMEGPRDRRRRRDGFKLTDRRYSEKQVLSEVDYCVLCHSRDKDSCTKGVRDKSGRLATNPVGIKLTGCPLDEKISEMHTLHGEGDPLGALALITIDNPLVAGTGHRICNDCMKACIYQKYDPVNIPQIETRVLVDVLGLPWGFEIYSLLTRWNPLNRRRPVPLPYNGKKVLVVGLGPAGYTLAHYLLGEGFGVVAIDGLKVEPLEPELAADENGVARPVERFFDYYQELDERPLMGFGGVAEYGITVRWDKNFLKVIRLCLDRRRHFRSYGGVRFGGTLTIDDAWEMGFDHIAIATGAGKPTIVPMKNNLVRGIRKASDFLMALQLTGAQKRGSLTNLQVRLPAIVIGGGLTAIDTTTEVMAYYPMQVEKTLERYEVLVAERGEEAVRAGYLPDELEILDEFLEHGRAVRAERERAAAAGEEPDFARLVHSWGGATMVYRKSMLDSPAYRLNHEEIIKAFEEGIWYAEQLSPVEALRGKDGALDGVVFERQEKVEGRWRGTGETVTLPARTMFVAAGTSPNVIYEREYPGTFEMDEWDQFFRRYRVEMDGSGPRLIPDEDSDERKPGVFTSYRKDGRFITYFGDNHPAYAGNVVKAMASARDGYRQIVALFEREVAHLDPAGLEQREAAWREFGSRLDEDLVPRVEEVKRLTSNIVEVFVKAPQAARRFRPGQFFRLQSFETLAPVYEGTTLASEGMALTGAWVDPERGLLSTIVLEMGGSSRQCATWRPGQPVVAMGPTGAPTEIPEGQTVLLLGGGLGNAVQFSIGKAMREKGNRVVYFAAYKKPEDVYHVDDIEAASDVVVWSVDAGEPIKPRREQDKTFVGNVVEAMEAYARGELGETPIRLDEATRLIAIGSDRMMAAVKQACHERLKPYLRDGIVTIGSINSTMQCMMKEICAQCLQKHVDPETGEESRPVFSCFNQDQRLDEVDFANLNERLRSNSVLEKLTNLWLDHLLAGCDIPRV